MPKGKIVILSGPSGVGKRTVRELLDMERLNMVNSVSMTTRAPRDEDEEGVTYFFVSPEQFEESVKKGELLEHAGFGSKAYGTPEKAVEKNLEAGRNVMLEIEVNGAAQVMKKRPDAISIFLLPPHPEDLEKRLRGRGTESEEEIQKRLEISRNEISLKDLYQYNVINDDPARAAREIEEIILSNYHD